MTALAALMLLVPAGRSGSAVAPQSPSLPVHGSAYGRILFDGRGYALYRYVGDRKPLHVLCQDVREFGGLWLVVRPNGTVVR